MAEISQSGLLAKVKGKLKGGWKKARQVTPQARSAGGLPPGLKGAVAACKEFKLAATQKGDPYFTLTGIIIEPPELENKRATASWFINDSEYSTAQDNAEEMANDLGLLGPAIGQEELPEDEAGILKYMKALCEAEVPFLFDTNRPKNKDRQPKVIIQGIAEGYLSGDAGGDDVADAPEEATEESTEEPVEEATEEPVEEATTEYEVGQEWYTDYKAKGAKKAAKVIVKIDKVNDNDTVDVTTKGLKPNVKLKGLKTEKLYGED